MNRETRATCTRALYDRMDAIQRDIHDNADHFARDDWRGRMHRIDAARELRAIRRALVDLRRFEAVAHAA